MLIPKRNRLNKAGLVHELAIGSLASLCAGFGLVFAFCAVGVNV